MITTVYNNKCGWNEKLLKKDIEGNINELVKILLENGFDNEFVNEIENSFEDDYYKIMNLNVKEVFDLLKNKTNSLDWNYKLEDFKDEDIYDCYNNILLGIVKYSLFPIDEITKILNGYEIKFNNGDVYRLDKMSNTPAAEMFDTPIDELLEYYSPTVTPEKYKDIYNSLCIEFEFYDTLNPQVCDEDAFNWYSYKAIEFYMNIDYEDACQLYDDIMDSLHSGITPEEFEKQYNQKYELNTLKQIDKNNKPITKM